MIQEKTKFGNGEVILTFLDKDELQILGNPLATSVHCFVINNEQILFTINPRGVDIIGGHVDSGENNEIAFLREAKEEACIIPKKYEIIGGISIDNTNNKDALKKGYPLIGYQVFYKVTECELLPFEKNHECTDRKWINKDDVKSLHHNWLKVHQAILDECFKPINLINKKRLK